MQKKNCYQLRHAAGMYWLIDMEQTGRAYKKPVVMNECGAYIWKKITESETEEAIAEMLSEKYNMPTQEALTDVREFMQQLKRQGITFEVRRQE